MKQHLMIHQERFWYFKIYKYSRSVLMAIVELLTYLLTYLLHGAEPFLRT